MITYVGSTKKQGEPVLRMPYGYTLGVTGKELPRLGFEIRAVYEMVLIGPDGKPHVTEAGRPDSLIANCIEDLISNWSVTTLHAAQTRSAQTEKASDQD